MTEDYHYLVEAERRRAKVRAMVRDVIFAAVLALAFGAVIGIAWGWWLT